MSESQSVGESMHPFDAAVQLEVLGEGVFRGRNPRAYANMVGPFGGITTAILLQAACRHEARIGEPISLTVNFAAPIADADFTVTARPVRTNRSTQHWMIELEQDGVVAATATAVFAVRRATWSSLEVSPPAAPAAHELARFDPSGFPAWTRNYDLRFVEGAIGSRSAEDASSVSTLWIRDEPPRPLDVLSLAAISDAFFPRLYVRRPQMVPASTITLTTYFHAEAAVLAQQGEAALLCTARAQCFNDGYFDQVAQLWGAEGTLLATSHQLVYYKQ